MHNRFGPAITRWVAVPRNRAIPGVVALACLGVLLLRDETDGLGRMFVWGTVTSVMYFALLILLLHGDGRVQRALGRPIFRKIATLGYGVYLVHIPLYVCLLVPLARVLDRQGLPLGVVWLISFVLLLAASMLVAYVLHVLVEKPSLRLRERFAA